MAKLDSIENVVLQVLENWPDTRSDDFRLMARVCDVICPDVLYRSFGGVMLFHDTHKLPNWKSIERARRKIQAKRPDLVDPKTAKARKKEEAEYREYAKA